MMLRFPLPLRLSGHPSFATAGPLSFGCGIGTCAFAAALLWRGLCHLPQSRATSVCRHRLYHLRGATVREEFSSSSEWRRPHPGPAKGWAHDMVFLQVACRGGTPAWSCAFVASFGRIQI